MSDEASSTDTSSSTELKAGHAPACKNSCISISFLIFLVNSESRWYAC